MFAPWTQTQETPDGPPVKKKEKLPNAFEVCEKVQSDYLTKLDLIYQNMPNTANRINRDNFANQLKQSCEEKARGLGYFHPIDDLRNWLFGGGGDQSQVRDHSIPEDWPKGEPATETPVKYYEDDPGYPGSGGLMPTIPIETV